MSFHGRQVVAIALAAFSLSACKTLSNPSTDHNTVTVERIDPNSKITNARTKRVKVSKISISVPSEGKRLAALGLRRTTYYQGSNLGSHDYRNIYKLGKGLPAVVQNTLEYVFDIDAASENTLDVSLDLTVAGSLQSNWWCKFWDVKVSTTMTMDVSAPGHPAERKVYDAKADDTYCTTLTMFPSGPAVAAQITKSLQLIVEQIIDSRSGASSDKGS